MKVIAEIGSNWDNLNGILQSIGQVAAAGCDGFKLQLFRADKLYNRARAPRQYDIVKDFEIPYEWLPVIKNHCKKHAVEFWLSVFDTDESLRQAAQYADGLKVASGDITNYSLLDMVSFYAENRYIPVMFSDGAANEEEVYKALDTINTHRPKWVILLHCVSAYPADPSEYNMRFLYTIRDEVDEIGISDHTAGNFLTPMAIALGCNYFEVHYKPNGLIRPTPDSGKHSLDFNGLVSYVETVRKAMVAMGSSGKVINASEENERLWARRGKDGLRPKEEAVDN